ncbi:hypothetical protein LD120_00671 [Mesoplasma sp. JKS002657]|nr:hypothetical protein [Mesoplasma sp. JKS002661]MCL8216396.1 hypothetical protein [Mesoplasma sp. JKS002657]
MSLIIADLIILEIEFGKIKLLRIVVSLMRNNAAIRPLPTGTNLKSNQKENYQALLTANEDNELLTLFWASYLSDLETKYKLIYHPGKELFQIYYHPGKTNAANKQIVHEVTQKINQINQDWNKIEQTMTSFQEYSNQELRGELKTAQDELVKLEVNKREFEQSLQNQDLKNSDGLVEEFNKTYREKRNDIQTLFTQNPHVKDLNKIYQDYLSFRQNLIKEYLKSNVKNLDQLLAALVFNPE